ncbi:hypothetical protein HispidOSU_015958 [Sigmodon hispidus]
MPRGAAVTGVWSPDAATVTSGAVRCRSATFRTEKCLKIPATVIHLVAGLSSVMRVLM